MLTAYPYIPTRKKALRCEYIQKREMLNDDIKAINDIKIQENFMRTITFRHSDTLLIYNAIKREIATDSIIKTALSMNKTVFLPRCTKSKDNANIIVFHKVTSFDQLQLGKYGIMEPIQDLPMYFPNGLCVCVVPGLVFDKRGYRIGYGKGYYDRFLGTFTGSKVGLCYDEFMIDELPHGRYDSKMDMIITEKGLISFNA